MPFPFRYALAVLVGLTAGAAYAQTDPNEPPPPRAAPRSVVSEEMLPRAGGVIVFGATNGVGLEAVKELIRRGEKVSVVVRSGVDTSELKTLGANVITGDVLSTIDLTLAFTAAPFRVVLSAIDGRNGNWTVDAAGNHNIAVAAKEARIPRMVMMSAIGAAETRAQLPWYVRPFREDFFKAKSAAETDLKKAGLTYTIVRMGWLIDKPASGKSELGREPKFSWMSRLDAGKVLADVVKQDSTDNQVLDAYDPTRVSLWSYWN